VGNRFSGERFFAAYLVADASIVACPSGVFRKEETPFAGLDSRLAGWFLSGEARWLSPDRLQTALLAGALGVPHQDRCDQAKGRRARHPGARHGAIPGHMDKISGDRWDDGGITATSIGAEVHYGCRKAFAQAEAADTGETLSYLRCCQGQWKWP
jgi:hypothetical protein